MRARPGLVLLLLLRADRAPSPGPAHSPPSRSWRRAARLGLGALQAHSWPGGPSSFPARGPAPPSRAPTAGPRTLVAAGAPGGAHRLNCAPLPSAPLPSQAAGRASTARTLWAGRTGHWLGTLSAGGTHSAAAGQRRSLLGREVPAGEMRLPGPRALLLLLLLLLVAGPAQLCAQVSILRLPAGARTWAASLEARAGGLERPGAGLLFRDRRQTHPSWRWSPRSPSHRPWGFRGGLGPGKFSLGCGMAVSTGSPGAVLGPSRVRAPAPPLPIASSLRRFPHAHCR